MFAEKYIIRNIAYPQLVGEEPSRDVAMIVMIPCLNEPEILRTLRSLWDCAPIKQAAEVLVVVNESENSSPEVKAFNRKTFLELLQWKSENDRAGMVLHPVHVSDIAVRHAGAGMARKIGMDEAIRRFNFFGRPDGIIVSLDSDCLVSENYLHEIASYFGRSPKHFAATINFRHRIDELADERQKAGIRFYEDYLHYYKKAHDYTGFPDSIYTIGSAFAVRADAYVAQGGMNRRQAGEDFYFLNKLTSLGKVDELNEAFVYPSARVSDRVPFGTGAAITKWMNEEGDLTTTYNFEAFCDLKKLFDNVDRLYRISPETLDRFVAEYPAAFHPYFEQVGFRAKIQEINQNSATPESFRKRFFRFFDAFVIMRFLNESHPAFYPRQGLYEAIRQLEQSSQ